MTKFTKATITLTDFRKNPRLYMEPGAGKFEIKQLKNSIEFQAGDLLTDEQVNSLITKGWTVIINKPTDKDY